MTDLTTRETHPTGHGPIGPQQLALIMQRARDKVAAQVGAVAADGTPASTPTDATVDEMPLLRAALSREAYARSVRAEANLAAFGPAAIAAILTFGGLAAFGPLGFVAVAIGGHLFHEMKEKT